MNTRYQIFISSTYEDLKSERASIERTILRGGDIPVGMEAFPAADEEQFEFIKTIILSCDYYVLIIAGRYGSTGPDGTSYTEKEYDFAVSKGIPVLVFVHGDPGKIEGGKSEKDTASIEKLGNFIDKVSEKRLRKVWTTEEGLILSVKEALDHAKATKPSAGWVKGDSVASLDALKELAKLKEENDQLIKTIGKASISIDLPDIPSFDTSVSVHLEAKKTNIAATPYVEIRSTWEGMFALFSASAIIRYSEDGYGNENWYFDQDDSQVKMGQLIAERFQSSSSSNYVVKTESFSILKAYYEEVGLFLEHNGDQIFTELAKKLARRLLISPQSSEIPFSLESGNFEDVEIPF